MPSLNLNVAEIAALVGDPGRTSCADGWPRAFRQGIVVSSRSNTPDDKRAFGQAFEAQPSDLDGARPAALLRGSRHRWSAKCWRASWQLQVLKHRRLDYDPRAGKRGCALPVRRRA